MTSSLLVIAGGEGQGADSGGGGTPAARATEGATEETVTILPLTS